MIEQAMNIDEILSLYADGPVLLEQALSGLPPFALDLPAERGGWTIRQIIHHITDGDDIWKGFIKRAIGSQAGEFTLDWYWQIPQDEWASHWAYARRAVEPSLALLRAGRAHIVQLLEQVPEAWDKCLHITWPDGREAMVSVRWVVQMQARHVAGHVEDIRKIREMHGV